MSDGDGHTGIINRIEEFYNVPVVIVILYSCFSIRPVENSIKKNSKYVIYTRILLMDSVSLSVVLIFGLYRPSPGPIALRNVLKCSIRHTLFIIRFWHFSSAAFIEKKRRTGTYASIPKSNIGYFPL